MNDNFLQENPLALFDDFVSIPEEAFNNDEDVVEIVSLIRTISSSDDFIRVLVDLSYGAPEVLNESKRNLEGYLTKAKNGVYGEGKKKELTIEFMNFFSSLLNEIQLLKGAFHHVPVTICRVNSKAILPKYQDIGDAGADLYTISDIIIQPKETVLISTGLKMAVPGGYKLEIVPRSGLSLKTSLRIPNSPATIDSGFRGEVKILAENIGEKPIHFSESSRIAQAILIPVFKMDWEEVDEEKFDNLCTERGKGFGSSGV